MAGSAGFNWKVDGKSTFIYFSCCEKGYWTDWDYDEDCRPCEFRKYILEPDYYEWNIEFYSGLEFTHIERKIIMTKDDLEEFVNCYFDKDDGVIAVAKLLQALKLSDTLPEKLKVTAIEGSFEWITDWDKQEEMEIPYSECYHGKWTDDANPHYKFEWVGKFWQEPDEDDEDERYYYIFNSGIEFTYLDSRIVLTKKELESLDVDTASMLLQVLNLDAS